MSELEEMALDYVQEYGVTIETAREMAAAVALGLATPEEALAEQLDCFGEAVYE